MSFSKNFLNKTPFLKGGYEGGGDVAGAHYIPTGYMYADMFAKIGQAISDIDPNKKKKEEEEKRKTYWSNQFGKYNIEN